MTGVQTCALPILSLNDCIEIKKELPELEIEIFVHGSMCFAFSGRCLISALQHGRVPNRGSCANDCRFDYEYYVRDVESDRLVRFHKNEMYVRNPDNDVFMRLEEVDSNFVDSNDSNGVDSSSADSGGADSSIFSGGTHIFNAKDLNLASHLSELLESNAIDALKIEGRTKSSYYAGITARTYRLALNDFLDKRERKRLYQ